MLVVIKEHRGCIDAEKKQAQRGNHYNARGSGIHETRMFSMEIEPEKEMCDSETA
ncbi:MAG: hypothetical protein RJR35_05845 [Thermoanaerobacterales bacterium]|nr:hypothetical protein [Thermoanaerobacterales bacterium]